MLLLCGALASVDVVKYVPFGISMYGAMASCLPFGIFLGRPTTFSLLQAII